MKLDNIEEPVEQKETFFFFICTIPTISNLKKHFLYKFSTIACFCTYFHFPVLKNVLYIIQTWLKCRSALFHLITIFFRIIVDA